MKKQKKPTDEIDIDGDVDIKDVGSDNSCNIGNGDNSASKKKNKNDIKKNNIVCKDDDKNNISKENVGKKKKNSSRSDKDDQSVDNNKTDDDNINDNDKKKKKKKKKKNKKKKKKDGIENGNNIKYKHHILQRSPVKPEEFDILVDYIKENFESSDMNDKIDYVETCKKFNDLIETNINDSSCNGCVLQLLKLVLSNNNIVRKGYGRKNIVYVKKKINKNDKVLGKKRKQSNNNNDSQPPLKKQKKKVFEYGNYHRYYGYRHANEKDIRTLALKKEWFEDKNYLDIGCNSGKLTLEIIDSFSPKYSIGVDIDNILIYQALKNFKSFKIRNKSFDKSIQFRTGQFISDNFTISKKFDVISCFSVSKWIHFNWGDEGIIKLFQKVFDLLNDHGVFIFEPQPWSSYKKKYNITQTIRNNYKNIKIKPVDFPDILTSQIGFHSVEQLTLPPELSSELPKGFKRPLYCFIKDLSKSKKKEEDKSDDDDDDNDDDDDVEMN